jgi:hypothetical protein
MYHDAPASSDLQNRRLAPLGWCFGGVPSHKHRARPFDVVEAQQGICKVHYGTGPLALALNGLGQRVTLLVAAFIAYSRTFPLAWYRHTRQDLDAFRASIQTIFAIVATPPVRY